jgi:hypothetical protein
MSFLGENMSSSMEVHWRYYAVGPAVIKAGRDPNRPITLDRPAKCLDRINSIDDGICRQRGQASALTRPLKIASFAGMG